MFFISSGQLSCAFNLNTLATGSWNVVVTNPDGKYSNMTTWFTVNPPPTVTSITPDYGNSSTVVTVTNLAGTRFQPGASVKLTSGSHPDITATAVNYVSPTQLTCTFNLAFATAGVRNVVVTNPDGKSATLVNGFTVMPPLVAPTVTGITPATGSAGSTVKITNLQGTGFVTGASVKMNMTGYPDISVTDVVVVNPTLITCNISIPAGATPWLRNVVVTNIDGQNGMFASGFTITGVAPTPTGITPSSGSAGSTIYNVNIAGTGFASGAQAILNRTSVSGIAATNIVVSSPTLITCDISIPTGTSSGLWNVSVSNTDGKNGILVNGFNITSVPPAPVTAGFTGTPVSGNAPLVVQFVDDSTGSPTEYLWNFGDTQTSPLQNPSHNYTSSSGSPFTVTLRVGNGTGFYNTSTKTGYITANSPATPLSFYDNFDVSFTGWTTSGTVTRITTAPRNGIGSIRLGSASQMQRTISTAGNSNIIVSCYLGTANNYEAGEYLTVSWFDGTTWTQLVQVGNLGDTLLHYYTFSLPASCSRRTLVCATVHNKHKRWYRIWLC